MAAPAPLKTYNLNAVFLIVGTVRVTGFGETDVATFELAQDDVEMTETADGQTIANATNSDLAYVDLTVMETSHAYKLLADLYQIQRVAMRAGGAIPALNFQMLDGINGDSIASGGATFMRPPLLTKAKAASQRVFRLALPNAKSKAQYGALLGI